tara:strand:- start:108 stop:560 length:453 start_codon:yes stop_codon:yes gene_type:complete
MNKKEKILQQLSDQRIAAKKYSLSLMSDLRTAVEEMRSYDLQSSYDTTFTEYEHALGLMEQARNAADNYIGASNKFDDDLQEQWASYERARDLYFEVYNQLQDLGVPESSELSDLGNAVAEGETAGQKGFDQTQSEFSEHNELVDVSNFN